MKKPWQRFTWRGSYLQQFKKVWHLTLAQAQFLAAEGCDEFQGFLYAKPLPFADFIAFAQERTRALKRA